MGVHGETLEKKHDTMSWGVPISPKMWCLCQLSASDPLARDIEEWWETLCVYNSSESSSSRGDNLVSRGKHIFLLRFIPVGRMVRLSSQHWIRVLPVHVTWPFTYYWVKDSWPEKRHYVTNRAWQFTEFMRWGGWERNCIFKRYIIKYTWHILPVWDLYSKYIDH